MSQASYEAVATTRPRIRRDVLFTQTPEGVLFHNTDGGFRLNARTAYRFATLVVPHLTGEHTVAALCEGLGDDHRAMFGELVKTLYERDFARSAGEPATDAAPVLPPDVARRFAPQIAYADHYADDAEIRFLRFRDTRVAVLGDDPIARWCALSLVRNGSALVGVLPGPDLGEIEREAADASADGAPVEVRPLAGLGAEPGWAALDGFDTVVVTGGTAAAARLLPLLRAGIPEGRTLLPAWSYGSDAVVGPLMAHGTTGCWACAALRLGANGDTGGASAELWSALALPGAPVGPVPGGPLAAMIGNLLGYEVFRTASGALPAETSGRLLVQDVESLDVTAEPLLRHPRCPFCSESDPGEAEPVDLAAAGASGAVSLPTVETAREADALVEELNRRSTLVRPRAGVFTRYADEALTQLPLKLGVVELGIGHTGRRSVAAFDVHHVAGARMRALDAAALVYAEHVVPARGPLADDGSVPVVDPAALALASGLSGRVHAHERAVSLLTKEPALVPAGAVRPFGPYNADRLFERTRAGAGAGPSTADAAAAGLLSALGHAALLRVVRGGGAAVVPLPDPDGPDAEGSDAELVFLVRSADRTGLPVELLDLGEGAHSGAQVMLARAGELWAVGAGLDRRTAAVEALRELLGAAQYEADATVAGSVADTGDPLLRDLDPRALAVAGEAAPVEGGAGTDWNAVSARLEAAGRNAYVVETGSADLAGVGIHTVRVLLTAPREPRDDA
ncbi:TOMM precursor leader peptide-binding protein [Streptomyces sp. NPDC002039]|uniref:TOMM precursor leader peptide-binding protein n=1 Tax=Streptomyces sp. NPDC002039 TaxID=3154660 RepID=UPI003317BFF5